MDRRENYVDVFSSLRNQIKASDTGLGDQPKPVAFHSIEDNIDLLIQHILSLDDLTDNEVKNVIFKQHDMLLNYDSFLSTDSRRKMCQQLFTNVRFLRILHEIIGLIYLTEHEKICLNKIAYDYYITDDKIPEASELLILITAQVNNVEVVRLSALIGLNGARTLSMITHSSFKPNVVVHRINRFLILSGIYFSIQHLVDIYMVFYHDHFSPLFIYTMTKADEILKLAKDDCSMNNTENILKAMFYIMDSMTSMEIEKLLLNYGFVLSNIPGKKMVITLKGHSPRIDNVIDKINSTTEYENIHLN